MDNTDSSSTSELSSYEASNIDTVSTTNVSPPDSNVKAPFQWVDESQVFFHDESLSISGDKDLEEIRKRHLKKRSKPVEEIPKSRIDKRAKNTLAARKYRERQRKDFEALDSRVKQLEQELALSKLETAWWKMESERWKNEATKK